MLTLVVTTAEACTPLTANGIDLVDEDDAGSVFLGLLEEVANAAGTNANKHLNELRTRDREEGNTCFTSHSLGEQGLTGARRPHKQNTLGDLGADGREAIGVLEEVDHLGQLKLRPFNAGHIGEGHLGGGLHLNPRFALAELHGWVAATSTLGAPEEEEQTTKQQQREDQTSSSLLPARGLTGGLHGDINAVFGQQTEQLTIGGQVDLGTTAVVFNHLGGALIRRNQHTADLVILHRLNELAVADGVHLGLAATAATKERWCNHNDRQNQKGPETDISPTLVHRSPRR